MAIKQRRGVLAPISGAKVRQDDRVDVEVRIEWRGLDLFLRLVRLAADGVDVAVSGSIWGIQGNARRSS
jgi:hypothetical protein